MKSLNRHEIIGHLGAEPTITTTEKSTVAKLRIATNESFINKKSGEKEERTEWHSVVLFNQLAKLSKFAKKGSRVYVSGPKRTSRWTDKEGQDKFSVETIAQDFMVLDKPEPSQANNEA